MIRADKINQNYYYPDRFKDSAERFLSSYKLEKEVGCPTSKLKGLKERKIRVCRFCHKKYPFVSFSKDAHVFSEFLGNKYLVSDFECDDCNIKFGKYENDLANFLGIVRTIQSVKGKKTPKFKSTDKQLEAESIQDIEEGSIVKLRRFDGLNKTFHFDKEKQQTVITYEKGPYTPLNVYKSILKMALSIIDEQHLDDYNFAFEYLRTTKHDNRISGFAIITSYSMPLTFQYEHPAGMLFKKINLNENAFTHVFSFSALNQIFQIVLPFNRRDAQFYKIPGGLNTLWCPPLYGDNNEETARYILSKSHNLNSTQRLYNQKEAFVMPTQPGEYEKSYFKNKETDEITEQDFDGSKIIGIDLLKIDGED
jgi:HNH endonuclease